MEPRKFSYTANDRPRLGGRKIEPPCIVCVYRESKLVASFGYHFVVRCSRWSTGYKRRQPLNSWWAGYPTFLGSCLNTELSCLSRSQSTPSECCAGVVAVGVGVCAGVCARVIGHLHPQGRATAAGLGRRGAHPPDFGLEERLVASRRVHYHPHPSAWTHIQHHPTTHTSPC